MLNESQFQAVGSQSSKDVLRSKVKGEMWSIDSVLLTFVILDTRATDHLILSTTA